MQKESIDYTRQALEQLTASIKENPDLLKHGRTDRTDRAERVDRTDRADRDSKKCHDDEEEDGTCSCASASKAYYLTLELNNALYDITQLKKQVEVYQKKEDLLSIISSTLVLNKEVLTEIAQDYICPYKSVKEITGSILQLENFYEKKVKKINFLKEKFLVLPNKDEKDDILVDHYRTHLIKLGTRMDTYYARNLNILETQITRYTRNNHIYQMLQLFFAMCVLFLGIHVCL